MTPGTYSNRFCVVPWSMAVRSLLGELGRLVIEVGRREGQFVDVVVEIKRHPLKVVGDLGDGEVEDVPQPVAGRQPH